MDGASNSHGEMRNPYKTFVRQPKWKRPFDRLGVCVCVCVRVLMKRILLNKFSVHQARDRLQCLTVVSTNEKKKGREIRPRRSSIYRACHWTESLRVQTRPRTIDF
jgi:hypothetical protein